MKRIFAFLCSIVLLLSVVPNGITVFAEKNSETTAVTEYDPFEQYYSAPKIANTKLANKITNAILNCTASLDISSYNLTKDELYALIDEVVAMNPELYNLSGRGYSAVNNKLTTAKFTYYYDADTFKLKDAAWRSVAETMLADIKNNSNLSTVQKLLILHDRLVAWCEYDLDTYENRNDDNADAFNMYGTLVNRTSVCQGYAKTYQFFLNELNIENYLCSSIELNHVWNIVKVDGKYYHVDVTFDDPVADIAGRVEHTNFLLSTSKLKSQDNEHAADDYDTTPSSTLYDNYDWRRVFSEYTLVGNSIYYIMPNEGIYCLNTLNNKKDLIEASTKVNSYSRLDNDGAVLYFNYGNNIYSLNPSKPFNASVACSPATENGREVLVGFRRYNTKYVLSFSYNNEIQPKRELKLSDVQIDITSELQAALKGVTAAVKYNGKAHIPSVTVNVNGEILKSGTDYTVKYTNNVNAGVATVKLTAKGSYKGSAQTSFTISPVQITSLGGVGEKTYTGYSVTFNPIVKSGSVVLKKGTDYTVSFSNNKNAGVATVKVVGKGNYYGSYSKSFLIRPAKVKGVKQSSGTKSSITVKWSKSASASGYYVLRATSKNGVYYAVKNITNIKTVKYTDKNVTANKKYYYKVVAYVTVSGKKYSGAESEILTASTATTTPKKPTVSKNTKKKSAKISWKKVSGASGYQVYMKTDSGKYKKIYSGTKKAYTKTKLKKGKKYTFKVRTYKTINGVKIYSSYSTVKSIKF